MRPAIALFVYGIVLISTGCGTRARFEYDHGASTISESLESGEVHRDSATQASRTAFEIVVERQSSNEERRQSGDQVAVDSASEPAELIPAIQIEIGMINLHLGDVNITHDLSQSTQKSEVTQQFSTPPEEVAAPDRKPVERIHMPNSRCNQLQRRHEETLAEWDKLFR